MPSPSGADLELVLGEDHPFGDARRAASPASASVPSGITAPGRATATVCPAATFGAPHTIVAGSRRDPSPRRDRPCTPSAGRRRGAARTLEHAPDDEVLDRPRTPWWWIASTFVPVIVRRSSIPLDVERGIAVFAQPVQRDPHPNCSRKRRSFSKYRRRSGMPCLSIAIRSTPIPQAKPCTFSGSYPGAFASVVGT